MIKRPLKLVKQENDYDCGVACLAIVLGISLDEVTQLLGRDVSVPHEAARLSPGQSEPDQIGVMGEEMVAILFEHGIPAIHGFPRPAYPKWLQAAIEDLHMYTIEDMDEHTKNGGIAIIGVASKSFEGQWHWIVHDGEKILDPGKGPAVYEIGEDLRVCQFVLIGETR